MKRAFFYDTVFGTVGVAEENGAITNLFFGNTIRPDNYMEEETPLLKKAALQMSEYAAGRRFSFDLPLAAEGTEFQRTVWYAMLEIPYGETFSYAQLAKRIGKPRASRAVGRAVGLNPISLFIPCHRVIGSDGKLTGYAGGLEIKRWLLDMERKYR